MREIVAKVAHPMPVLTGGGCIVTAASGLVRSSWRRRSRFMFLVATWHGFPTATSFPKSRTLAVHPLALAIVAAAVDIDQAPAVDFRNWTESGMSQISLYPLRFEPIYQYRLWGGRRLANLLSAPLPGDGPIGEAWVLSDREDHQSHVANGPLKGQSISALMEQYRKPMMGRLVSRFGLLPIAPQISRCS